MSAFMKENVETYKITITTAENKDIPVRNRGYFTKRATSHVEALKLAKADYPDIAEQDFTVHTLSDPEAN